MILLEGLPGSGKSTNSRIIMEDLERLNERVRWIHEVARPHPTLFFHEACLSFQEYEKFINDYPESKAALDSVKVVRDRTVGIDLLELEWNHADQLTAEAWAAFQIYDVWNFPLPKYMAVALEKWKCFVEYMKSEPDLTLILDSSIFQFQIYTFLERNTPFDELEAFIQQLFDIVSELEPALIYLYKHNVEDAITDLENTRGVEFFERIWQRDRYQPYYQNRTPGAEGYREFLRDYHYSVNRLYLKTPFKKISIDTSKGEWDEYVATLLNFLHIEQRGQQPSSSYPIGTYKNQSLGASLEIHDGFLIDPTGKKKRIHRRIGNEFYIEDLPVILKYKSPNRIVIQGEQLIDRWTATGTEFLFVQQDN